MKSANSTNEVKSKHTVFETSGKDHREKAGENSKLQQLNQILEAESRKVSKNNTDTSHQHGF
jgi:hypothetical protein